MHHVSGEQRSQKPQEETALINLARAETGISARRNRTHYGTFYRCTRPGTQSAETPAVNQSFTNVLKWLLHANPALGSLNGLSARYS